MIKWRSVAVAALAIAVVVSLFGNWIQYQSLKQKDRQLTLVAAREELEIIQSELTLIAWKMPQLSQKLSHVQADTKVAESPSSGQPENLVKKLNETVRLLERQVATSNAKREVLEKRQSELQATVRRLSN